MKRRRGRGEEKKRGGEKGEERKKGGGGLFFYRGAPIGTPDRKRSCSSQERGFTRNAFKFCSEEKALIQATEETGKLP